MGHSPINAWLLTLALLSLVATGCSRHYQSMPESMQASMAEPSSLSGDSGADAAGAEIVGHTNLVFTPDGWPESLSGDLYRPKTTGTAANRLPAVIMVHGGGWKSRSRGDTTRLSKQLAENGFVVFNVSYRFAPEYLYPAAVDDVRQAIAWLRRHADEFGVDANRIGAWGYSSGAHLVALVATTNNENKPITRLQAVVAGGTPADLRKYPDSPLVTGFLGSSLAESPALYEAASPTAQVSADDPPAFIYHGGSDLLVKPDQAQGFKAALDAAGVPNELYIARFKGHATMFLFHGAAFDKAVDFLRRVLAEPGGAYRHI